MSQAEGAVLAGCLAEAGCELVRWVSDADIVVYNTCAVKGPTEDRVVEACRRVADGKKLIVTGCLPLINSERLLKEVKFDGIAGPAIGEEIVGLVHDVLRGEKVFAIDGSLNRKPPLTLPRIQKSSVVSIVPINHGCLGSCAYCCVVLARGRLRSYTIQEIVERVTEDLGKGFREFWLTSQDTACYGKDIGTNLAELLSSVCELDGDFKVRVGMMTPNTVIDILEQLADAFREEKIFKFIHLPVQSGDDQILRRMRRFYSADEFRRVVGIFRSYFPCLTIATDIICGFPGEEEEAFGRTLELVKEVRPDILNVSKFFPRPETSAADMQEDFVSRSEIKRRSSQAGILAKRLANEKNKQWTGWRGAVLIDEVGKISGSWVGRNLAYKPIVIKSAGDMLGKTLNVVIVDARPTYLEGEIVE